jgi:hypothetical protein
MDSNFQGFSRIQNGCEFECSQEHECNELKYVSKTHLRKKYIYTVHTSSLIYFHALSCQKRLTVVQTNGI